MRSLIPNIRRAMALPFALIFSVMVGCGGGSGGSTGSGATPPGAPGNTVVQPVTQTGTVPIIAAAAPTPTYSGVSEEMAAFNQINLSRSTCGFGTLRQNTKIDSAALNHVTWMAENNSFSHTETAGTTGFTGDTSAARFNYVGYSWTSSSEVMTGLPVANKAGFGLFGTRNLLGAPYHLMGYMQGNSEIGISIKTSGPNGSGADIAYPGAATATWYVADLGSSATYPMQSQTSTDVLTYPCQGVTNTITKIQNESPNPITNRNLATTPIGQPVFVQVAAGQTLSITTSSIVTTIGANPVLIAKTLTAANDDIKLITANQAIIIPDAPLAANTQYTVTIQGTNNGSMFLKSFTFTTGT